MKRNDFTPSPLPEAPVPDEAVEALVRRIGDKAENLYLTRQFYCTESVLVTLNRGLGGGLTDAQAIAVAAPFSIGVGDSGCMCGALAGSILAAGLFMGGEVPYRRRKQAREVSGMLHDLFKARFGGVCCRILRKKRSGGEQDGFKACARVTAEAAGMAARVLLEKRPELARGADGKFLDQRDSLAIGTLRKISRMLAP